MSEYVLSCFDGSNVFDQNQAQRQNWIEYASRNIKESLCENCHEYKMRQSNYWNILECIEYPT